MGVRPPAYWCCCCRLPASVAALLLMFAGFMTNYLTANETLQNQGYTTMYTGKKTKYRAYEYITWQDQASLQCCQTGPCGGDGQ
jgi:hypothetical protein